MTDRSWTWRAAAILLVVAACPSATAVPSESCDTGSLQALAPADTTVSFAAREVGGGCRVHGHVTTTNPGPNRVLFVLMLPDDFNGRYLYLGVGGAAGALPYVPARLYRRGYAIAGSDGGTGARTGADFSFRGDPARSIDFAWRGVHVSARATQQILAAYYGRPPTGRYISGCSGGGQMSLANALRFGRRDFDGFIVGATPLPGSSYLPNLFRIMRHIQTHPEGWIPPELARKAEDSILAAYDESDGARDGIIADARDIRSFDRGILRDAGFTPEQMETFDVIQASREASALGLPDNAQQPGFPVTSMAGWTRFPLGSSRPPWKNTRNTSPGELVAGGAAFFHVMVDTMVRAQEPETDYAQVSEPARLTALAQAQGDFQGDFAELAGSGGKLIVYHGVNDEAMSYLETLKSYQWITARHPDHASWLRVFPVAGLMHCRGGIGPSDAPERLLEALAGWVEESRAPDRVVTRRVAAPESWAEQGRPESFVRGGSDGAADWEREFLLCAEPARVALRAPGLDPRQAGNWTCRTPGS